jgi:histidinol dehydrogenase
MFVESPIEELSVTERTALLQRTGSDDASVAGGVRTILERVRKDGDRALLALARELDKVELDAIEVPSKRCSEAAATLAPDVHGALVRARDNIAAFHRAQLQQIATPVTLEVEPGVRLERRTAPLVAVGVYAPGGRAAYPSSVLMGAVPAVVAGVAEIVVCSPPGANGLPSTEVLAAAHLAGATRVFALGGAGAVAAMAFGTRTVPTVGSIVGPGNAWVTEAKRQVAGAVRIDSPAGPSELLILADRTADPELVAVELLAQAEHDTDAVVGLVTSSSELLASARTALEGLVVDAGRREIVTEALARRGFLLLARSLDDALAFAIDFAAEHLTVMTEDAETHADAVTTAGTVFLGGASSVAFGDYMTGANHVLPTGGLARTYSGLSVEHYLRSYTVQRISPPAAAALAGPVAALARAEGLPGHATAALARSPR